MQPASRFLALVVLPAFTLLLGWQLGVRYEQHQLQDLQQRLDSLYTGGQTGSGTVIDPEKEVDLTMFWGVWRLLVNNYINPEELGTQKLVTGAVQGLVNAIGDPYTLYMTPQENTEFRDSLSGHLQGIGAELSVQDGDITIVSPIKGSPAEKAGLLPEDVIIEVNGESIEGKTLQDAVTRIRGKKGTSVTLTVLRESADDLLSFTIVRDDITVPSTEYEVKTSGSGSVGILTINQFGTETVGEVQGILEQIDPASLKGLVIDLRFNGGGYLEGAVDIVSMFLREGKVVSVERRNAEPQRHYVSGRPILPDLPLVILQNQASASASEIVAGALQDHDRAKIIGMTSFGKGTVQEVIDLPGGSSLRVTIAKWLTPDGRDLGKEGVVPDIEVDRTQQDIEAGLDPQMNATLEWVLDGEDVTGGRRISSEQTD